VGEDTVRNVQSPTGGLWALTGMELALTKVVFPNKQLFAQLDS